MDSPAPSRKTRLGSATLVGGGFAALSTWWELSWILLAAGVIMLWRVAGWWRVLLRGAIGGLTAGALVLAPGFRLAMRAVAVLEPEAAELTIDGTLVVFIVVGGLIGVSFGALGALARFGWAINWARAWTLPAGLVVLLLLAHHDFRSELFDLGAGAWVNIPLFGIVAGAYGWVVMKVVELGSTRETAEGARPVWAAGTTT